MCFSAGASFSAAGALSVIGLFSIKSVQDKRLYRLALIPLFFALQQFSEGVVWLGLGNCISAAFIEPASYAFLFFAFILWPIYIPSMALAYETNTLRKRLLYIPLAIGLMFAASAIFYLIAYGIQTESISCHILYSVRDITFSNVIIILYALAAILPFFISSIKKMWLLGTAFLISCIVSFIAYTEFLTSVWCFFAALISMLIYWVISSAKPKSH